jgi:outer membrane protein TolC
MKRAAWTLLNLVIALSCVDAQDAAPVITLPQSIDAALANGADNRILAGNLGVAQAQHALNVSHNSFALAASAGYGQVFSYGNPTLQPSVSGPLGSSGPTAGVTLAGPLTTVAVSSVPYNVGTTMSGASSTNPASSTVGVAVSQTLWNGYGGGPTQATVDKSLLSLQGKQLATDSGRLSLQYKIKQAYYTMLAAQRNASLKSEIRDKQDTVLKQIQAIYGLKAASLVDLKTAQINARSAQVDADSADHDLRMARIALAQLMGMPSDAVFTVADAEDPTIPVTTLVEAIAEGMKRRVELKQLDLSIKSGAIDAAVARGLATPTVSVSGSLAFDLQWSQVPKNAYALSAGVKVSMPVLDAGTSKNQADAVLRQNAVYALQETQLQQSIASDIRNAWEGVDLAKEKLDLAKQQADVSALQYEIQKTELDNGTASNQDVLTASVNDANARTVVLSATSAVQLALLQLLSVMGF